ncbi:hypothetical protein MKX08_001174 [Trichoderma sp. CBMAI-0020]|nr:hypothetical protein MKX08_001174 [Trichoderma sp. CBMAI-0020]
MRYSYQTDPFSKLPLSALIAIAKDMPDLASLHSFRLVSPACAAVFMEPKMGAKIVELVARRNLDYMNQKVFGYIWALLQKPESKWPIALGRPFPISPMYVTRSWLGSSTPTTESTLRILVLGKTVHDAAHRCLHTLLQRFTALRPWRPDNAKCNLKNLQFWRYSPNTPFRPPPELEGQLAGINLEAAAGPLEWFEEQNAVYGAWLLALYGIVRETPEPYIWPPPRSTAGHIKALQLEKSSRAIEMPQVLLGRSATPTAPIPHRPLSTFYPWGPTCSESGCSIARQWFPGPEHLQITSRGKHFLGDARETPWSAIRAAPIGPFRALGFSIWGEYRFINMGLLTGTRDLAMNFANAADVAECSDWYAWKSVLTLPQLEALKDAQYDAWVQWQQESANRGGYM